MTEPEAALADVLWVAREHSTMVAARWAGWTRKRVVAARQRYDNYSRGRGHPTAAELAAEPARPDCRCPFCRGFHEYGARSLTEAVTLAEQARTRPAWEYHARMQAALAHLRPDVDDEDWRQRTACRGYPPSWWFPSIASMRAWDDVEAPGKVVCRSCPVRQPCLEAALERGEPDGVWGGLDPWERRRLVRSRRTDEAPVSL